MTAKNKARTFNLGEQGIVQSKGGPDWGFLYRASTVKDAAYNVGDRVQLPDGRVFYYAKSGAACNSGQGVAFYNADPAISGNPAAAVAADGTLAVTFASQTFAENALQQGFIHFGAAATTEQFRGITGNTAASSSTVTIYMDAPLNTAITTSTYAEVMYNPWSDVRSGNMGGDASWAGVAATYVSAADTYFWVQTWGPMWCAPQAAVQATAYIRMAYWRHDGSLDVQPLDGTLKAFVTDQPAGFVIGRGSTQGPPLIMLQVTP